MDDAPFDARDFRQALGSFATGVTIITTRAPDGEPLGLTVSSFNSVSLQPPLVLWSLAESSFCLPVFKTARNWAVHVLSSEQEALSTRFASSGTDKFNGVEIEDGLGGIPLLRNCTARFQCETAFQYQGGDHLIFVGEVKAFDRDPRAPLVFHGGRYAHATQRDSRADKPRSPYLAGSFSDNFLGYLLGRSHFQFFGQIKPLLEAERLSDEEFYILSTLTLKPQMTDAQLDAGMAGVLDERSSTALASMVERGLVQRDADAQGGPAHYQLTSAGRESALRLISAAKAVESQVIERLGSEESAVLKSLLHRMLDCIDPAAEKLWQD